VGDHPAHAAPELEAELRQLGRLAGAGLAGDDHDLVAGDRRQQVRAPGGDRQLRGVGQRGDGVAALGDAGLGGRELDEQARVRARIGSAAGRPVEAPAKVALVAERQRREAVIQQRG
jgi:hypothetical protein